VGLADVIGQDHAAACLRRAVRRGRVAHGYLFCGPAGVGKARMALAFAALLACRSETEEACGRCRPCRLIAAGTWPDLHLLEPEAGRRTITVEQVRALIARVYRHPVEGPWKVFIVRDADHLREEAQNLLLKTLEEPPPDSVLILLAARPDRLVPTLHSRLQPVRFHRLRPEHLHRLLERREDLGESERRFAAAFAAGSVGEALDLAASKAASLRDLLLERLPHLTLAEAMGLAEEVHGTCLPAGSTAAEEARRALRRFLDVATRLYRDLMVVRMGGGVRLYNADRRERLERFARSLPPLAPERCVARLLQARVDLDRNANRRLLLEGLFMDLAALQAA